jgi:hypothetical protein
MVVFVGNYRALCRTIKGDMKNILDIVLSFIVGILHGCTIDSA